MAISSTTLVEKEEAASAADANVVEETVPEVIETNELIDFLSDDSDDLDLDADITDAIEDTVESKEDLPSSAEEEPSDAKDEPEPKETAETPVEEAKAPATEAEEASLEPPAQEATPKPEQQAETTPPASAVEEPAPLTFEQAQAMRANAEGLLAEHYKMSEDQVTQFELNPEQAIPKLAARIYMDAVTGALQQVQQALPSLLDSHTKVQQASDQNETSFYNSWPQLNAQEATPTVMRIGQVYRQLNPQATAAEFIRDVGAQAMVALRIAPQEQGNGAADVPKIPAFKPAGSSPRRGTVSAPDNVFAALSDSMDAEDLDLD